MLVPLTSCQRMDQVSFSSCHVCSTYLVLWGSFRADQRSPWNILRTNVSALARGQAYREQFAKITSCYDLGERVTRGCIQFKISPQSTAPLKTDTLHASPLLLSYSHEEELYWTCSFTFTSVFAEECSLWSLQVSACLSSCQGQSTACGGGAGWRAEALFPGWSVVEVNVQCCSCILDLSPPQETLVTSVPFQ
eukprot:SM000008S22212  [mRNA]  locus=s8:446825:448129:- [translate_table: standard]